MYIEVKGRTKRRNKMKLVNANLVRKIRIEELMEIFATKGEDVGQISSNSFNFPIVVNDEEGWMEVTVKVPKTEDGFEKREDFQIKELERAEKKESERVAKEKKIKRDTKNRAKTKDEQ